LRAGVGWEEGLVGNATEKTGTGSQAGYTLLLDGPVILEDMAHEARFDTSPLLLHYGVISGMSAIVGGERGPFGVIGAHTRDQRVFTEDDVNFLQAVANVLGEAIEWRSAEEGMREVREAERRRMARDLHDGALQDLTYALTAAQLAQSMAKDPNVERWLERTAEALKRTGRELRTAVYDLRLESETDRPLPELVRSLVELNRRMSPRPPHRTQDDGGSPLPSFRPERPGAIAHPPGGVGQHAPPLGGRKRDCDPGSRGR
jgi:signal transduction histidine kinase